MWCDMKKIFLLVVSMILITGCSSDKVNTVDYVLDVGSNYKENITFYLPNDAKKKAIESKNDDYTPIEYELLYEDIKTNVVDDNSYYDKKIVKGINYIKVDLNHTYTEDDFIYSQYINNCFENYELVSYKNNFDLKLSGDFYCYEGYDVNILLKTDFNLLSSNGAKTEEGYVWKISKNNYLDTDINFSIERKYDMLDKKIVEVKEENHLTNNLITLAIGAVVIFALVLIYKKYSK